jgi:radical SAM superfamily enzyme YgiQ (UPF0313 family)
MVAPRFAPQREYYVFPLGLAYVTAALRQQGFEVSCLNLCHHQGPVEDLIEDAIRGSRADVLCTGAMSWYWNEIHEVLRAGRRAKPDIVTVVGGAAVTSTPELILSSMPIDYGVLGEGERTIVELAEALREGRDPARVPGLVLRRNGGIVRTALRPPIRDLDALPFPDLEAFQFPEWLRIRWHAQPSLPGPFFDVDEQPRLYEMVTSRSCPFRCTFCYHPLGQKYRQRSLDNVFAEIDRVVRDHGINLLNVQDELFALDEERLLEFARRIRPYGLRWMAQWRVEMARPELLRTLRDSGLFMLGLGIESMSDTVLRSMKKRTRRAQVEAALTAAHEAGVRVCGNIILGDPAETPATVAESMTWWLAHPEHDVNLQLVLAVPDAPIYRDAITSGVISDPLAFIQKRFPLVNLTSMTDREYDRVVRQVMYYDQTRANVMAGEVLDAQREAGTPESSGAKPIYRITLRCPDCGRTSVFRQARFSWRPQILLMCKHCYKRLRVATNSAFPGDFNRLGSHLFASGILIYAVWLARNPLFRRVAKFVESLLPSAIVNDYAGFLGKGTRRGKA